MNPSESLTVVASPVQSMAAAGMMSTASSGTNSTSAHGNIRFGAGAYDFTAPEELPLAGRKRVSELLETGHLFRYGKFDDVSEFEKEFAAYLKIPYAMAVNSGGCGLFLALKALGVKRGDKVLVNSFTLLPVPGAIVHAGATPVFVRCREDTLQVDLKDLADKAADPNAKVLLISYMRGHVPDMDEVMTEAKRLGLKVVEDCAHTLGARWRFNGEEEHRHLGTLGDVGVWSMQTNKSINCGEGGVVATRHQDVASYITIASGCYAHFARNGASGCQQHLSDVLPFIPNFSMRMTTIVAALARPQLAELKQKLNKWEANALSLRKILATCPHFRLIEQRSIKSGKEIGVFSSVQLLLHSFSPVMIASFVERMCDVGVPLAWFGGPRKGFTVTMRDWKFADPENSQLYSLQEDYMRSLVDIPLYHTSNWGSRVFKQLGHMMVEAANEVATQGPLLRLRDDNENRDWSSKRAKLQ